MHLAEGILPLAHAAAWTAAAVPFACHGVVRARGRMAAGAGSAALLGVAGGFAFAVSAVPLPSVGGSCSHATGLGLAVLLLGPGPACAAGILVLVFQALLLAHGGLSTLGANTFSMAVSGTWTAWAVAFGARRLGLGRDGGAFLAAALGNLATYAVAAFQLALAFPRPGSGVAGSFGAFAVLYGVTQVPLAVIEGLLTVLVLRHLAARGHPDLVFPSTREAAA